MRRSDIARRRRRQRGRGGSRGLYSQVDADVHRAHLCPRRRNRHAQGLAAQPALERQAALPHRPRRHRLHPGGDVEGRGRSGRVRLGRSPRPGERHRRDRRGPRRCPRAGRLRARRQRLRGREPVARLPHHAEGARRRLPDGPPAPVDPRAAAAGDPARPARGHRRLPRLLQLARVHPRRHADLHALGVRGHDHAVPGPVLRGHHRLPHAERSALQRGERDGARPRLRVRSDVPRREVEDAPAPHRVLDGRARDGVRLARRHDGPRRGPDRLGRLARARQAGDRAEGARARHVEARERASGRSRASPTTRRSRSCARPASRSNGAATSAAPTRR